MSKNYSLNLPQWGPYNKIYLGAAHVADKRRGLRFDLNLFPGYFRRSVMSVRDLADSGAKLMGASRNLTRFVYRYEIEWKDKVYIEADFKSKNNVMTVTCDFVNNTDRPESLSLNAVMSMKGCTDNHREILPSEVRVKNGLWVDALEYSDIKTSQALARDGRYLCEGRESGFVGGSFIDANLFGKEGDKLCYDFEAVLCEKIGIRYRGEGKILLKTSGQELAVNLPFAKELSVYDIAVENKEYSHLEVFPQDCKIDFDGFIIGGEAEFENYNDLLVPKCEKTEDGLRIAFGDMVYTVKSDYDSFVIRKLKTDDVGQLLTSNVHNHVSEEIGNFGREYIDMFIRPLFLSPNSKKTVTLTIEAPAFEEYQTDYEIAEPAGNSSGDKYRLSQKIMSAVTLTNVVWPIYSRRGYILHNTPGRNWDSLYTWDSGFIGMGLLELDAERAKDCLNAYLTPVGDIHSPYIFHGTPLPTQIFLYAEIFFKTGNLEFLREYYPMIRQQYRFFADKRKSENCSKTGIFNLWDVFYNSGGWDDYPTQKYVHDNKLEAEVSPVINTAMTVLCGKILKGFAELLDYDTSEYDEDIRFYSHAINKYAWDEESGYYGYVKNDGTILKVNGVNADMGMDGVFPYVAGVCDEEKSDRIMENIKKGMLTPLGVSVVDTRAPYYRNDGYWNGSVWMPHQWILWKACLDNGESQFAEHIAKTALDLWEEETSHTYNCYEHFMITNGRGGGFHQFSGLSTPVLMWYGAYYKPNTVTSGFMSMITNKKIEKDYMEFNFKSRAKKPVVIVCMPEGNDYIVKTSGKVTTENGVYTIGFDGDVDEKIIFESC